MEKEKVIASLDNCIGCRPCENCPYEKGYLNFPSCAVELLKDALAVINELEAKSDESCVYAQLPLGMLINSAIKNENVRAMVINGLASIPLVIVKEDLLPIKDWVESFCIMYSVVKHGMPNKRAYELLKNKIVYILGTLPRPDMKKGETFGYEVVKREVEGEEYESIKCFLTPESARKYNKNNKPVTPVMVQVLHDFFGNVIGGADRIAENKGIF